jgi:hypothetical protein
MDIEDILKNYKKAIIIYINRINELWTSKERIRNNMVNKT